MVTNAAGLVSDWQDQSGNTNDAAQANTNLQPTLASAAGLGGRPVVRFNGIQNTTLTVDPWPAWADPLLAVCGSKRSTNPAGVTVAMRLCLDNIELVRRYRRNVP